MSEHPHTTEGDIECSCNPLVLTVEPGGAISRIAGGPLEEPIDTGAAPLTVALARLLDHHDNNCPSSQGPGAECVARDDARDALKRLSIQAAPLAEGLDQERLARAIALVEGTNGWDWEKAMLVAAEYARLSRPSDERVEAVEEDDR